MTARLGRDEAAVLLELLVTRCPVVVYVLDADGVCTYSAGTPLARLGLTPGELVGQDVVERNAHDPVAADNLRRALAGETCSYTWTGPDTTRFEAWLQPVLDDDGRVRAVVGVSVDVSDAWRAEASEHARVLEQQDVLHQLLAVQDAERERISGGLHDDTVQVLAALALRVSTLRRRLPGADPSVSAELSAMSRDLAEAGTRLRDVVAGLQPELLVRAGLTHALQDLLARTCDGPTTTLDVADDVDPSDAARRVLYEVAVEALGNVAKHARATTVRVAVSRDGGGWVLEVVDDGVGTEVDEHTSAGFGLRAMRQRAVAAGGTLEVGSAPGRGTAVRLRVPDVATFRAHEGGGWAADPRGPLEHILQNVSDAFVALDTSWRYVYVNRAAAALFSTTPDRMLGERLWTLFPAGEGSVFDEAYRTAVREQRALDIEEYFEPADRWFRNRVLPSPGGLTVFIEDVTERRRLQNLQDDTDNGSMLAHTWFVALASDADARRAVAAGAEALVGRGLLRGLRVSASGLDVAVGVDDDAADDLPVLVGGREIGHLRATWPDGSSPWTGELSVMLAQALAARLAPGPSVATGGEGERSS